MSKFEDMFTRENANKLAVDIIKKIDNKEVIIDYNFQMIKGEIKGKKINTWIKFDAEDNKLMQEIIGVLSDGEIVPTEELIQVFTDFRHAVMDLLSKEYVVQFTDSIRNYVFDNKISKEMCPMGTCAILEADIFDVPLSSKYLLRIKKTHHNYSIASSVSKYIYDEITRIGHESPHIKLAELQKEINGYLSEKKDLPLSDPSRDSWIVVDEIELCREFYEYQFDMFIDYSMKRV
jgi:hypothetical protein